MQTTTRASRARLDAALAAYAAAHRAQDPEAVEDALSAAHAVTGAILTRPAGTVEALKLKAEAMAWELEGVTPETLQADDVALGALRGLLDDIAGLR